MESFYEKQAFDLVSKAIESALRAVELEKRHNLVCIVLQKTKSLLKVATVLHVIPWLMFLFNKYFVEV